MRFSLFCLLVFLSTTILAQGEGFKFIPPENFEDVTPPPPPDYSNAYYWAALPEKNDMADLCPSSLSHNQDSTTVDVFYVHPTIYGGEKEGQTQWNASFADTTLNKEVDERPLKYQATAFNKAGRIYAPRYRQAHIYAYYTENKEAGYKALDFAYQDVKAAFEYYLEHYNNGRPFIIASHSQGTTHAGRLILELVDNKPIQEQFVVAYLIGIPVPKDTFKTIPVCQSSDEINCFCSWRTWRHGTYPDYYDAKKDRRFAVTNPISWKTDTEPIRRKENKGSILFKFDKIKKGFVGAKVHEGLLWVKRPPNPVTLFFGNNYHIGDINLFYVNIRENAVRRVKSYYKRGD